MGGWGQSGPSYSSNGLESYSVWRALAPGLPALEILPCPCFTLFQRRIETCASKPAETCASKPPVPSSAPPLEGWWEWGGALFLSCSLGHVALPLSSPQHLSPAMKGHKVPKGNNLAQVGGILGWLPHPGFQLCVLIHREVWFLLLAPSCITAGQHPWSPGPWRNRLSERNRHSTIVCVLFHKSFIL